MKRSLKVLCGGVAGLVVCCLQCPLVAFTAARLNGLPRHLAKVHVPSLKVDTTNLPPREADSQVPWLSLSSLCGLAVATAVKQRCQQGSLVTMRVMGRAILGAPYQPKIKNGRKINIEIRRNLAQPHSSRARKVARRYPLYDILEEMDKTCPEYTIMSEPEEPLLPVEDVPLVERYPWAGSLEGVADWVKEREGSNDTKSEPLYRSLQQAPPPQARLQSFIQRRGHLVKELRKGPEWMWRPMVGEEVWVPHDKPFKKDRRPTPDELFGWAKRRALDALAEKGGKEDAEDDGDMDAELDALSSSSIA